MKLDRWEKTLMITIDSTANYTENGETNDITSEDERTSGIHIDTVVYITSAFFFFPFLAGSPLALALAVACPLTAGFV